MSRDRDPFERTVALLRRGLRTGAFGHGQPLHIQDLARELAVSSTPVREALARLAGEGLIDRSARGYLTPKHDSNSVRDLYGLDEIYALAALGAARARPSDPASFPRPVPMEAGYLQRTEVMLARLGMPQSRAFWFSRRNLWNRLAPFREAEAGVLDGLEEEIGGFERRDLTAVSGRDIRAYYRRRTRAAATIVDAAYGRNIGQIYLEYVGGRSPP